MSFTPRTSRTRDAAHELTQRYLVELCVPSGRITGGYLAHHFVEFAVDCEQAGYEELATATREALDRDDRLALRDIAHNSDLQPEIVDDPDLYDEIDNNYVAPFKAELQNQNAIRLAARRCPAEVVSRNWPARRSWSPWFGAALLAPDTLEVATKARYRLI